MTSLHIDIRWPAAPCVVAQRLTTECLTRILQHVKGSDFYMNKWSFCETPEDRDVEKTLLACTLVCKAWTQPALAQLCADVHMSAYYYNKLVFDDFRASFCHGYLVRRLAVDIVESLELLSFTPNLQELDVRDYDDPKPFLGAWLPPTMTRLSSLSLFDIHPLVTCPLLSASPALSRLTIVDMSRLAFEDEAVWLAYKPAVFRLHCFVLRIYNCTRPPSVTGISKIIGNSQDTLRDLTLRIELRTAEDESAWLTAWLPNNLNLEKLSTRSMKLSSCTILLQLAASTVTDVSIMTRNTITESWIKENIPTTTQSLRLCIGDYTEYACPARSILTLLETTDGWLPHLTTCPQVDVEARGHSLEAYFDMVIPFQSAIRDAWRRRCVRKGLL